MLKLQIGNIDAHMLEQLCQDRCPESITLEFKKQLSSGNPEKDKFEIAKDVCAMANSEGGLIIYGIDEQGTGQACALTPLVGNADDEERRITQILLARIEPRVPGVSVHTISVNQGFTLIVRVEPSYDGPHCVRVENNRRFVMRSGTTTLDMDHDQIRTAFDRTATLQERAQTLVQSRCALVRKGRAPLPLEAKPMMIVHLMPMLALSNRYKADMEKLNDTGYSEFRPQDHGNLSRRLNLDGIVIFDPAVSDEADGYRFVFRNGCMEAVFKAGGQAWMGRQTAVDVLYAEQITGELRRAARQFFAAYKGMNVLGAAILQCTLVNAEGYALAISDRATTNTADRDQFDFPPEWIESIDGAEVDQVVAPILHTLWQSFGRGRCGHFDENTGACIL